MTRTATAQAYVNIALAKYWGKCDSTLNLPAVPSLSLTLWPLRTTTTVLFDEALTHDTFSLNGENASEKALFRATRLLDRVRSSGGFGTRARVQSVNDFPTASGLASSASGFAALAVAARAAAGLTRDRAAESQLARTASASAARSIYDGFAILPAGRAGDDSLCAYPLAPQTHWDLRVVIAVTTEQEKSIGSSEGMERTRATSTAYQAWIANAPLYYEGITHAVQAKDFEQMGEAMERSTFDMHACMRAAMPSLDYFNAGTHAAYETVKSLRKQGTLAYATMDAGPHVKVFCEAADAARVQHALADTVGVLRTIVAQPGPAAELLP